MKRSLLAAAFASSLAITSASDVNAGAAAATGGGGDDVVPVIVILTIIGLAFLGGNNGRARTKERSTVAPKGPSNGTWKF